MSSFFLPFIIILIFVLFSSLGKGISSFFGVLISGISFIFKGIGFLFAFFTPEFV